MPAPRALWLLLLPLIQHPALRASAGQCGEDGLEACPADTSSQHPAGVSSWTLRSGQLEVTVEQQGKALAWGKTAWLGSGDCSDELAFGPLFAARLPGKGILTSKQCTLAGAPVLGDGKLVAALACPDGLSVEWSASVEELEFGLGAALRVALLLSGLRVARLALLLLQQGACVRTQATGSVDGSPVRVGSGRFILAMEHPLAKHKIQGEATNSWGGSPPLSLAAEVVHLGDITPSTNCSRRYGAVVVAVAEPRNQGRRAFAAYLSAARPRGAWQGPLVHYNSWYDFTSWQDEGFFKSEHHAPLLQQLRTEPMAEEGALQRVSAFGQLTQRGVQLDSFLWDDGWDDPHALWTFDRAKFPRGFEAVAARAKRLGAGLGVWLSPWGGYGQAKEERLRLGRKQGFETNEHGFSLAGPRYAARFKAAVLEFRRTARVNMFKFDGVAGDPAELPAEVEAMLCLVGDLREEVADALWINLTTGTWPSPFFLLWVDSIWRGLLDTHVPDKWPSVRGLSRRQQWQVWRECVVHELVVRRAALFPIARLMVHGAVLAGHGDALANGLHELAPHDWAQEVWSLAAMGLQLQELYVSAKLMSAWAWDELASALQWSRTHWEVLQDAHWVGLAGCQQAQKGRAFRPYALAAYRAGLGFLFLRNPRNKVQMAPAFSLENALELPSADAWGSFILEVVRRVSKRGTAPLDCGALGADAREVRAGRCELSAQATLSVKMEPGELLVLRTQAQAG